MYHSIGPAFRPGSLLKLSLASAKLFGIINIQEALCFSGDYTLAKADQSLLFNHGLKAVAIKNCSNENHFFLLFNFSYKTIFISISNMP